jgi:mono/diheme cytochrome c family protein
VCGTTRSDTTLRKEENSIKSPVLTALTLAAGAYAAFVTPTTLAGDLSRGKSLHDTFCIACHSPVVYQRKDRLADSYLEVRQQVERWQGNARLRWSSYDIESVTDYLADKYYKIPY